MKKLFIIANWKSNKTTLEATKWLQEFHMSNIQYQISNKEAIICPPYTLLPILRAEIERLKLPIKLGAQDFSAFSEGAYTGEEPPSLLTEYVQFAIIGHSERRKYIAETDELIAQKVEQTKSHGITPILCIQDVNTLLPKNVTIVAYEPIFAIGTGSPDTPENAQKVAETLHVQQKELSILYGGSVTADNVASFTKMSDITGVLVGTASLDPISFAQIIQNA